MELNENSINFVMPDFSDSQPPANFITNEESHEASFV